MQLSLRLADYQSAKQVETPDAAIAACPGFLASQILDTTLVSCVFSI